MCDFEVNYLGGQQAIRLYSALGKCFRSTAWQELPLVALHAGAQTVWKAIKKNEYLMAFQTYTFQAPHTATILAAGFNRYTL